MEIDFSSASCGQFAYIDAPQVPPSGTEIGYPCPLSTYCTGGPNPGFQKFVYQVDVVFNIRCADWVISFQPSLLDGQVLGRNNLITTLNPPLGNLYTETTLDNLNHLTNSSVTFQNDPILFICAGQPVTFNMGATDPNADSLVYKLVPAMESAGVNVSYVSPLSGANPLFPVGSVTLNSSTGDITINTSTLQVGVIDIKVYEYKNGVLMGTVMLDMQIIIQACSNNYPDVTGMNGTNVFVDSVCAGSTISFFVNSSDPDAGQIVTMSWNNGIPSPAGFSSSGSPYPTGTFTWTTTSADVRSQPYTFTVTVKDNNCPSNGFETHSYSIYVVQAIIGINPVSPLCSGQSVNLTATGGSTYIWSPSTGLSSTTGSPVLASPSVTTTYSVTGTNSAGCSSTASVTVAVNPRPTIGITPSSAVLCSGQSTSLTASGGSTYTWSPSTGLSASTGSVVSAGPTSTTTYTVTGTDANGCTNTKAVTVTVNPPPALSISPASPVLCNGQSTSLTVSGATSYIWSPSTGLSGTTGSTVSANPSSTTTYTVTGTDANGCTNTKSVTVTINPPPTINITPPSSVLCNGQSVVLTASGGTTYTWAPSTGLSATTGASVTASPGATTTYTVTGTDANGCTNTKSATITINPKPTINASPANPVLCNGQSVALTASGGVSYIWSPSTGLSSTTGSTVSANPSSTTTYTVVGTDANGCTNTKTLTVTINPLPTINVSPTSPSICNGQSVALTASGGTTYTWSPSTGLSGTTGSSVSAGPSSTTIYTVTGTDANGCSNTKSVTVTVNPLPTITISPASPVLCKGQSVFLTAGGGSTYVWSPSTGLSSTTGSTVTANPSSTTTYTVTGTDANGCSNTRSMTVTINPLPTININSPSPICKGQSVTLTAGGGSTYIWSPSTGLSSTTGSTVSANPNSTTTYTVIGTDANGCSNTKSVTVTINPLPTVTINPTAPAICNGQSIALTAGGATTYSWSPSTGLSSTTGSSVSAGPSSTTTYTVVGTDANGCSNTKSVTVTINPLPTITVSSNAQICNGQAIVLNAGGGTSYSWSPSTGLSGTTGSSVTAGPSSTTTYTVVGTDANGCSNTKSVTITVNPLPPINVNSPSPVCKGQSVALTATGGTSYIWSPSTGLSSTTGSTVSANPNSTTTYTITGTDANGCSNTKSVTVTINPLPTITISPPSATICKGQAIVLNAGGGSTYVWSPSTGLSSTTGSSVTAGPSTTTTYTVTGTDANGCTNTKGVTVTINPSPTITVSPSQIICNGQSVALNAGGGTSYAWSPSTGLSATTGANVTANPSSTTTYTVVGTDANGCTNTKSTSITVNPLPVINASPATSVLCNGQSVTLTATGGSSYVWSPSTGLSSTTGSAVSAQPSSSTTYTVTGTDVNGCSATKSVTVTINPLPNITVTPPTAFLCNGASVAFTASGGSTYIWSPSTYLSSTTGSNVTSTPSSGITYTVTGTDANGCSGTASAVVTVIQNPVITVIPANPVICKGQSIDLTASGGNTFTWSPITGLSSGSGATVTANPAATTTYVVTGTIGGGCSATTSVTVSVNPLPVINAVPNDAVICNGQSAVITAGGASTYSWSPSTGLSSTTGSVVTANPSSTTVYTVTGTDVNGCSSTTSVTLTVNSLPSINITPNSPVICNGQTANLSASGGISYIWSPATGLSTTTGSSVSASPSSTTTYTVTVTGSNGCTNTATATVTVNPLPVITVVPTAPVICNGQSVILTAGGGTSYSWSPTGGLSSSVGSVVTANPSSTTLYTITGTDNNGCINTTGVNVTVNPLPVISISPIAPVICYGQSVDLTASGGNVYSWSPSAGLSGTTGATVTSNPSASSTYTVLGTDGNGCTNTASVTVTVNPLPVILVSPTSPVICNGQSVILTASGGTSYAWTPITGLSSGTGNVVTASPSSTISYVVTGTDVNGCSNTSGATVTVNPLPTISVIPPSPAICIGKKVTLTASGGSSYIWSPITGLSSGTGASVDADPVATSTYTVTGTDGNGCSSTTSVTVTVNPLPDIIVIPPSPAICIGQSVTLFASGAQSYIWNPSTGLSVDTGTTVDANPASTITYVVTGTDMNGCSNTTSVPVRVNPLPSADAGVDENICIGASVQLHETAAPAGSTYLWSPSSSLNCSTCPDPVATPPLTTSYIVTVTDTAGCSMTDTVQVIATLLPVNAGPDTIVCYGQSINLHAEGGTSYIWTPSMGISDTTIADPVALIVAPIVYTATISSGSCSNTATVAVDIYPPMPPPSLTLSTDTIYCSLDPMYKFFQWYYQTDLIPGATGTYYVAYQNGNYNCAVTDTNGCSISVGINIVLNVGLNSMSSDNSISVYPNPTTDKLVIKGLNNSREAAIMNLYNVIGEKLYSKELSEAKSEVTIDVANLAAGTYFVEVLIENKKWIGRVIKE